MNLPLAPEKYDPVNESNMRAALEQADRLNHKKGQETQLVRLVLADTVTGTRYLVTVASGALTLTAL
jgi:hypothetical protein